MPLRYSHVLPIYALSNSIYFSTFLDVCLSQLSIIHLTHLLRLLLIVLDYHLQLLFLLECYGEIHTLDSTANCSLTLAICQFQLKTACQLLLLINKRSYTLGSSMIDIRWHKANKHNEYSHTFPQPSAFPPPSQWSVCFALDIYARHSPFEFSIIDMYFISIDYFSFCTCRFVYLSDSTRQSCCSRLSPGTLNVSTWRPILESF